MFPITCKYGPVVISLITNPGELGLADVVVALKENSQSPEACPVEAAGGRLLMHFHVMEDPLAEEDSGPKSAFSAAGRFVKPKPKLSQSGLEQAVMALAQTFQRQTGAVLWPTRVWFTQHGLRDLRETYDLGE